MRKEFIKKLNNRYLGFYVNIEANGLDYDGVELSADDFDQVEYTIENDMLMSWDLEDVVDLNKLDDDDWEEFKEAYNMSWFEYVCTKIIDEVIEEQLFGYVEFMNLIRDEYSLLVLLKDFDGNVYEEIYDYNIANEIG